MRTEGLLRGAWNRLLQLLARNSPGATSLRVSLNRWRGVKLGKGVWIGYDAIIETSYPHLVTIGEGASIGIRATIIAHFREVQGVTIEPGAFIGPGAIIMPGVTIGRGAVVTAGSVVTQSIPPMTLAQGNPAKPVARIGVALDSNVTVRQFSRNLKALR
jgi:acetyltransferase-like isoleucine patch superfamily enzyme